MVAESLFEPTDLVLHVVNPELVRREDGVEATSVAPLWSRGSPSTAHAAVLAAASTSRPRVGVGDDLVAEAGEVTRQRFGDQDVVDTTPPRCHSRRAYGTHADRCGSAGRFVG